MEGLRELDAENRGIKDLTGIQFATNLRRLELRDNQILDLSPLAVLVLLHELELSGNAPIEQFSDLSPLAGLINLKRLDFDSKNVSDLSPLSRLTQLEYLHFTDTNVFDFSPLAGLINLESLGFNRTPGISDISPLSGLVNLKFIGSWGHGISDISPLAGLTKLEKIDFCGGDISDLTPIVGLPNLKELYIAGEKVTDISPLAGLTGLTRLGLENNDISDISPLAGIANLKWLRLDNNNISVVSSLAGLTNLTWLNLELNNISNVSPLLSFPNLTWLNVSRNNISDLSVLEALHRKITTVLWADNPAIPKGGPKIEGPWLWVVLSGAEPQNNRDLLSEASGGAVTELAIATNGATAGNPVGNEAWTSHRLPSEPQNNIGEMLGHDPPDGSIYGTVSVYSPREQETTLHVGADNGVKVWLNGIVVYENLGIFGSGDYTDFAPVTLRAGKNILLVAVGIGGSIHNGKFGFKPGTEYTVSTGVGYTLSKTPIHLGDTFTLEIRAENVPDLAGWQFDLDFDPTTLEAVSVTEGDFLQAGGVSTFFHGGSIDNAVGKITGLSAARLASQGATGTGVLLQVEFKAKLAGETQLTMQNFQFAAAGGDSISAGLPEIYLTVEGQLATGDVNGDGIISILDMVLIVRQLGQSVPPNSAVDLNSDGVVSILDLVRVAQGIAGSSAAPPKGAESVDAAMIESWIAQARLEDDGSLVFKQGIAMLETLLASLIPKSTALLRNYPNPFNPETWLPYQLAEDVEVQITIYDVQGAVVRRLDFGYQRAGYYTDRSEAAYWDGRNDLGESVGSGIYFYQITAGNYSFSRKLVILK